MNENEFTLQRALDGSYLNVSLDEPVLLDNIAVKVLGEDCPEFLVPFKIVNINNGLTLKYKLTNAVALAYVGMSFTKSSFIDFYQALLKPFMSCADWFLDYHYICINNTNIYLNKSMTLAQYIYIPETSYRNSDEDIVKFFKTVIDKVEITDDSNFLLRLYQYFSRNDVLLTELDEMLQHERIKQSSTQAQTIAHNNIVQSQQQVQPQIQPQVQATKPPKLTSPFVTQPKEKKENPIQTPTVQKQPTEQADSSDELMAALFGDNNSKKKKEKNKKEKQKKEKASFSFGLFGKKQDTENTHPSSLEQQQPKQQQTVAEPYAMGGSGVEATEYYGGYTGEETVISEDGGGSLAYLELVESSTPGAIQRISLDFTNSYITIGRESKDVVQANIRFNASFKQISRMHARIDRNGDTYSLIDLGSANRTMVNNQILIPNNPCVLKNGDKITFATNIPVIYSVVI